MYNRKNEEVATRQSWHDVADALVCSAAGPQEILDELVELMPDNQWLVIIQKLHGGLWVWDGEDYSEHLHYSYHEDCDKTLLVWTTPDNLEECSPETGVLAQDLVDDALADTTDISRLRDYLRYCRKQFIYYYKSLRISVLDEEPLSHHMLFAVTEGTQEWTATFQDSACTASNQQVIYLTKGP